VSEDGSEKGKRKYLGKGRQGVTGRERKGMESWGGKYSP